MRAFPIPSLMAALCSTDHANTSNGTDASGHRFSTFTEVVDDPDGNLLATVVTTTTEVDRGTSHTEIVTCPGQPPEVVNCEARRS